jgi:hypothetical protein
MGNRFENRILRLSRKTHGFVSHETFCKVRDYFEARFEEVEKPIDLEQKVAELIGLEEIFSRTEDPAVRMRFRELLGSSEAIWLKSMIPDVIHCANSSPMGVWLLKPIADMYIREAADAKEYFAHRKEQDA